MSHQCVTAYLYRASILSLLGGNVVFADNASVTPTNPSHQAGDTLLCIGLCRWNAASLSVSGTGWGDATGFSATGNFGGNDRYRFFMLECTSGSEANPTVNVSGGGAGGTVIGTVIRIRGRIFGATFTLGTVSANGNSTTTILLAQNSPSIATGDAILAFGMFQNDVATGNWSTLSGQTAGLTWSFISNFNNTVGFDQSGAFFGAINDSGSAYTAGTGGSITGGTSISSVPSNGAYLKIAAA